MAHQFDKFLGDAVTTRSNRMSNSESALQRLWRLGIMLNTFFPMAIFFLFLMQSLFYKFMVQVVSICRVKHHS